MTIGRANGAKIVDRAWNARSAVQAMAIRPSRLDRESDLGYLLRRAERNGIRHPRWLMLDEGGVSFGVARCCSQCLAVTPQRWSTAWEDSSLPFCLIHKQWLVDTCGGCELPLKKNRIRLANCRCGFRLADCHVDVVPTHTLQVLTGRSSPLSILLMLGAFDRFGLGGKPLKGASCQTMSDVADLLNRGAAIVAMWPASFMDLLDRQRIWPIAKASVQLLNAALPGLSAALRRRVRNEEWSARLHEGVREYVTRSLESPFPLVSRNKRLAGPGRARAAVIEALGLGSRSFKKLVAAGATQSQLAQRTTKAGRARQVVRSDQMEKIKSYLGDRISRKQAAHLLGLEPQRLSRLRADKYLHLDGESWSRKAIERFATCHLGRASVQEVGLDQSISISQALRYHVPLSYTTSFFRALEQHEIGLYAGQRVDPSAPRVGSLRVLVADLMAWYQSTVSARSTTYTLSEAAVLLGVKKEVAYQLESVGLLKTCKAIVGRRTCRAVSDVEIDRFKAEYEPLAPLVRAADCAPKHGYQWAQMQGLRVVSGPEVDGCRQYFVQRPSTQMLIGST